MLLDAIFGPDNLINQIVWRRATSHNDPSRFGRILDHMLYYRKSDQATWNGDAIASQKSDDEIKASYPSQDERGRYRSDNLTGPLHGANQVSPSTQPRRSYDVFAMGRCWSVPKTGKYAEYIERKFIPRLPLDRGYP